MAFTARPIKEIALAASESEYKTGIPLDVETLKMLMKNRNLTFKLQKANITAEQQRLFACAEAHLVFDKCSFEESGSFLLGHEFDPRRNRSGMHVVFMFDYPPLEKVSEALDNGWFKSIGFGECDFQAKDIGLLQKLHDASENQGSDFSLGLLSSVTLTVRSQEYGLGNIRNLLRGDPAMRSFVAGDDVGSTNSLCGQAFQPTDGYSEDIRALETSVGARIKPTHAGGPCNA